MKNIKQPVKVKEFETSIVAPVVQIKVSPNEYETIDRDDVYLELHVYDLSDNLIASDYAVDGWVYDKNANKIKFDILTEMFGLNFESGRYKVKFRLYQNLVGSNENVLYIDEIASSKKEIRVKPYSDNDQLVSEFLDFFLVEKKDKYGRILQPHVNLKEDRLYRIVNWQPDFLSEKESPYSLVLKFEGELSDEITTDDFLYITLPQSQLYEEIVNIEPTNVDKKLNVLSNANFEAKAVRQTKKELDYHNWTTLVGNNEDVSTKILSKYFGTSLEGIELNVDFNDFSNFVFYSSAEKRLANFKYKLETLESYDSAIATLYDVSPVSSSITSSVEFERNVQKYSDRKQDLIKSFDLYENHLYFTSGSDYSGSYGEYPPTTWPKRNSQAPYELYAVSSSEATTWYNGMIDSASYYDRINDDALIRQIPEHIRNDEYSSDFEVFTDLIAQHFDILWLYTSHMEKIYERKESLYEGIAKDLIYTLLQSYGWEADEEFKYDDLWKWDLGANANYEYQVTGSGTVGEEVIYAVSESMPRGDVSKETWKRIWNNLPYLLKTKGTKENIYSIMSCYGVPRTLLDIREFGGPEKIAHKSYWVSDKFTYGLDLTGNDEAIGFPYRDLKHSDITPNAVEFRFKTVDGNQWGEMPAQYTNQSLIKSNDESIVFYLEHTTGQFGKIKMFVNGSSGFTTETSEGPFFDGNWWHFAYNHNDAIETISVKHTFKMYAMKSKYDEITHVHSASFDIDGSAGYSTNLSNLFGDQTWYLGGEEFGAYTSFTGQMQELRMWAEPLEYDTIVNHALAPTSYVGNDPTSSFDTLAFRLPLGTDLRKYDHSLVASQSLQNKCPNQLYSTFKDDTFRTGTAINFTSGNDYTPVYETYSTEWPDISANRRISNKIRIDENQLSGDLSLTERVDSSHYDTFPNDSPKIGVYLSPTNEVDEDIAEQLGGFRIDDYIGEWDDIYRTHYQQLWDLKRHYFKKYSSKFDTRDYLRLAKFFNNSMFKQIKNTLPARSNKIVGIVIEPHILNRSKVQMLANAPQSEEFLKEGILTVVGENSTGDENYYEGILQSNPVPLTGSMACDVSGSTGDSSYGFYGGQVSVSDFDFDTWSNQSALQAFIYQSRSSTQFSDTIWTFASSSIMYANTVNTVDQPDTNWTNETNATRAPDGVFTDALASGNDDTKTLNLTNFEFEIPQDASISRIILLITRKKTEAGGTGDVTDSIVKLKSGYLESQNVGQTSAGWITSTREASYAGDSNYWKRTFSPADVNSSGFGVQFVGKVSNWKGPGTVGHSIDAVGIQIEYYIPSYVYTSETQLFLPEGASNSYYKGSKLTATDFNVPSTETPDGGPIVEFHITDAKEISVKKSDSEGNLDVK